MLEVKGTMVLVDSALSLFGGRGIADLFEIGDACVEAVFAVS